MEEVELVLLSIVHGVATITLNRPADGNSWTGNVSRRYFPLVESLATNPDVRVVVLTGAGKAFCVGGDAGKLDSLVDSGKVDLEKNDDYYILARIGKPVVAAINGACFGVGLQQILCCDVRFASDEAKFSTAYARRGLVAEFGVSWLLPRIIGMGAAMDLLLSARLVRAVEAQRMGLVTRVIPAADLMNEVMIYAREMADRCSPKAMQAIKQQCYFDLMDSATNAYARSESLLASAMQSDEFIEGVKSWHEKRAPRFAPLAADAGWIDLAS